jgi:hypothetical protein
MDHKRASFKPVQDSPWPTATPFAAAAPAAAAAAGKHSSPTDRRTQTSLSVDASGRVSADLICRRCGYALRGLPAAGKCPECGVDVAESLRGDLLIEADPVWLERIASGLRWSWILALVGWLVTIAAGATAATRVFGSGSGNLVIALATTPIILARMATWWMFTTPETTPADPSALHLGHKSRGFTAQKATRIFGMIALGALLLTTLTPLVGLGTGGSSIRGIRSLTMLSVNSLDALGNIAYLTAVAACFFSVCLYLKQLARRANDNSLLGYCHVTMIVAPVLTVVLGCVVIGVVIAWFMWWAMLISAESSISSIARARRAAARLAEYSAPTA